MMATAYSIAPGEISYPYWQYVWWLKANGKTNIFDRDWNAPFYEINRSPAAEKLNVEFMVLDYMYRSDWDKAVTKGETFIVSFPDNSRLYLPTGLNKEDRDYISKSFWDQRWGRWGKEAGKWLGLAFIPPAVLFLLGWCLLWIGRGFKAA